MRLFLGVAQVVARYLGVVEAVGSSPVTQTKLEKPSTFVGGFSNLADIFGEPRIKSII